MKKLFFYFSLIIFFIINCNSNGSQNKSEEELSKELEQKIGFYVIPKPLKYTAVNENFIVDKFYPIGWSQDGYFAYIYEASDQGMGYSFFDFVIISAKDNKIIWQNAAGAENCNTDSIWNRYKLLIKNKLTEYKIIQQENFELGKLNFTKDKNNYSLSLENNTTLNTDYGFDVITETYLFLTTNNQTKQKIYEYKETEYPMILGQVIAGQILCPYNDYLVTILRNEHWGYEGPPNVLSFQIIATKLTEK